MWMRCDHLPYVYASKCRKVRIEGFRRQVHSVQVRLRHDCVIFEMGYGRCAVDEPEQDWDIPSKVSSCIGALVMYCIKPIPISYSDEDYSLEMQYMLTSVKIKNSFVSRCNDTPVPLETATRIFCA